MALKDKKVLVLGLGDTGLSALRWLAAQGAILSVADTRENPPGIDALKAELPNVKIHTGLAMEIPDGTCALVLPRSGIASKKNLAPINAPGLCDSDYRGEYMVALHNYGNVPQIVTPGERIAQVVFINYLSAAFEQVNSLEDTDRGTNGFGSTGTK